MAFLLYLLLPVYPSFTMSHIVSVFRNRLRKTSIHADANVIAPTKTSMSANVHELAFQTQEASFRTVT